MIGLIQLYIQIRQSSMPCFGVMNKQQKLSFLKGLRGLRKTMLRFKCISKFLKKTKKNVKIDSNKIHSIEGLT